LGPGQHTPGTPIGNALLAHELTHVVQQRHNTDVPASLKIGPAHDKHEAEADRNAAVLGAMPAGAAFGSTGPTGASVQRIGPAAVVGLGALGVGAFALGFLGAAAIDYAAMTHDRAERFANE